MDDEGYVETQYGDTAKGEYRRRADEFVAALREHVELVLTRKGREREMPEYFESTTKLENAAAAFNDVSLPGVRSPRGRTSDWPATSFCGGDQGATHQRCLGPP